MVNIRNNINHKIKSNAMSQSVLMKPTTAHLMNNVIYTDMMQHVRKWKETKLTIADPHCEVDYSCVNLRCMTHTCSVHHLTVVCLFHHMNRLTLVLPHLMLHTMMLLLLIHLQYVEKTIRMKILIRKSTQHMMEMT